jgi:hypothetical protein
MASALGQSIYGWPHEMGDDAFGVSWGGTEAGFDALALARTDLGLPLDEITLANPRTAEQVVYKVASGTKGPRATFSGQLRETAHASVLVLSTGEKSLAQFIGKGLQEGARKRLVDVPAEVQPGTAFETIPRDRIHIEGKRLFDAMKRQHGAVDRDWQRHLVFYNTNVKGGGDVALAREFEIGNVPLKHHTREIVGEHKAPEKSRNPEAHAAFVRHRGLRRKLYQSAEPRQPGSRPCENASEVNAGGGIRVLRSTTGAACALIASSSPPSSS